jgi:zinc protease
MVNKVTKYRMDNGLTIQLKEIHTTPIISHWVWYRVGSREEIPGKTGVSHWVEHMQFKGTPQFPGGVLDKAISREGGMWNAFTYVDWTTFFETLPADKIDLGLRLEADRMLNSVYEPQEVESERTVVISEREGSENEPLFRLGESVQAAAFDRHPYHYEIIGDLADLKSISRDELYAHYREYYCPNNAVIAVAGDFNTQAMLDRIIDLYHAVPVSPQPPHPAQPEPPLKGERQVEIHGPDETTYLQLAYRAPAARVQDFFAFTVMDSLLTGPTGLNMFGGGGISNKTSRLYRTLVEKELAVSVNGGLQATIDPYLYDITMTVHPQKKYEAVLSALDGEVHRLQDELVSEAEIARAVKQARALFIYGSENITNQAFWLGYAEMFADYNWFLQYVDCLEKVTPVDVQRIAREYLAESRRVVGVYLPENGKGAE